MPTSPSDTAVIYNSWFEILHSTSTDSVFVLDVATGFCLVYCNEAFVKASGVPRVRMLGKTAIDVLGEEAGHAAQENYRRCVATQKPILYEEQVVDHRRTLQTWHTLVTPKMDDDGEVLQLIGISRNVTALKTTQGLALDASLTRQSFLATIGPELRSHLDQILHQLPRLGTDNTALFNPTAGTNAAMTEPTVSDAKAAIQAITLSLALLRRFCDDIDDFAQVDVVPHGALAEPIDIRKLAETVWRAMNPVATSHGVKLHFKLDPGVPHFTVLGDPKRVTQIFCSLIDNSLHFTQANQSRPTEITVSALHRGHADIYDIKFDVIAAGRGMTSQQFVELFKPYARLRCLDHNRPGGLYLAQELARRLGGIITLLNDQDGTLHLTASIPFAVDAEREDPTTKLVLVVDDDAISTILAREILVKEGWAVLVVNDGAAAVTMVQQKAFDLILMDVVMPGLNGIEATQRIRAMGIATPILGYTADVMLNNRENCLAAGMNEVLTKPIRVDHLAERARFWAQKKQPPTVK